MTPEDFVQCCLREKEILLNEYMNPESSTSVQALISSMALTPQQKRLMAQVIDGVLTDTFYTFLLGLDGAASIGGRQELYKLFDEEGRELTGELEGLAWEAFQETNAR